MKKLTRASLSALLLTTLFLGATTGMADKTAGERVDDSWLHTKVKTALVGHGSSSVNIEVYHGRVQLAGFFNSETEKEAVLAAANGVEGVEQVHDQLYIVEPGRSAGRALDDGVLTSKVKGALADSDLGRGFDVNVEVNRGVVLLSGFVVDREERGTALTIAESVTDVVEVINGMDLK